MKTKSILVSLILALSLFANAGHDGPQAAPPMHHAHVLAEYVIAGFFVPPGEPTVRQYQIMEDGTERLITSYNDNTPQEIRRLKNISPEELAQVKKLVSEIQPGKLFDPNPEQPSCQDAPTLNYLVYQGVEQILIGQRSGCKTMKHENETAADAQIIQILEELAKWARENP